MTTSSELEVGQEVWLRYGNARYTSKLKKTKIKKISAAKKQITTESGVVLSKHGVQIGGGHYYWTLISEEKALQLLPEVTARDLEKQRIEQEKEERDRIWQEKLPRINKICEQASLNAVQEVNKLCGSEFPLEPDDLNSLKMWLETEIFNALKDKFR